MTTYDGWASVYDAIYSYVREDIPFYTREAKRSGGAVLELGCGTGRVAIPIADAGVDVVGLDASEAMLNVAREKSERLGGRGGSLEFLAGDMRDIPPGREFSLIVIPFRGFLELLTVEDQIRCLASVKRRLTYDGRLIFNIFVPDPHMLVEDEDAAFHLRDVTDPDTGRRFALWQQTRVDTYDQILSVRLIVDEIDRQGVVTNRLYRDYQIRYAHRLETLHLLERCGFEVVDVFGDFEGSPMDEHSGEMVWVARARQ